MPYQLTPRLLDRGKAARGNIVIDYVVADNINHYNIQPTLRQAKTGSLDKLYEATEVSASSGSFSPW